MRLGLDIGTNSIGWWLYRTIGEGASTQIVSVIDGGVRIFSDGRDPKSGASLAVNRRAARATRRRRDRYLRRRATLMRLLARSGLMPKDPEQAKALEKEDPYALRAKGLYEKLPLVQFGRVLFHLNQRRGFKSNRKTDRGDNESGKIKDASQRLDWAMRDAKAQTYGEFLYKRRQTAIDPRHVPTTRTRLSIDKRGGTDAKEEAGYDFYPDRRHLEAEFYSLWEAQAVHWPELLTEGLRDLVYEKIFFQRPLKEPNIGLCLFTAEPRLPKAHPLTQRRVIYETVNQLRVTVDGRSSRQLTREERDRIVHALDNKKPTKSASAMNLSFNALGKLLKLRDLERFTLETGVRDAVACDPIRVVMNRPDTFAGRWSQLNWEAQWDVISRIRLVQSDEQFAELIDWLMSTYKLEKENATNVANAHLPEGYSRLGLTATKRILDQLKTDVITYAAAVSASGWHHSDQRTGEIFDALPYYGEVLDRHVIPGTYDKKDDEITRFGRITNPTVHVGLNQLRRLVNKIIAVYGKPDQIVVELARDLKQSKDEKREAINRINAMTDAAKKRSDKLKENGVKDTGYNRMLLRLWEELGPAVGPRRCPYTGKTISVTMVLNGDCDIDHILPYSRTLDDSFANRTLCIKEANREKRDQTPFEAWGADHTRWSMIEANLKNLSDNKKWRFSPDAMKRFEGEKDFLDRALVDTQYLARISRTYLETLYTEGGHVWVVPGRMTEMLRRHWGLNGLLSDKDRAVVKSKNRADHRHHAIDAAVIAATDRGLLNAISKAAGKGEQAAQSAELIARDTAEPWDGFRKDIQTQLNKIIVSHRADHGRIDVDARKSGRDSTAGQLHNDTAYGIVDASRVVSRAPLLSLKPSDIEITTKGKNIRDPQLQKELFLATKSKKGKEFEAALRTFANKDGPYQGIRRVRLIESLQSTARVEVGRTLEGEPLKAYKGDSNYCYEIWRLPDGKIQPQIITTFEAHTTSDKRPHPAAKRILRVLKKDTVEIDFDGERLICVVQKLSLENGLFLAPHSESNCDARHRDKQDPFKFIQKSAAPLVKARIRKVFVDEIGNVRGASTKTN